MGDSCSVCSLKFQNSSNHLVTCGNCSLVVHQGCYGIQKIASNTKWFCRKCESQVRMSKIRCDMCPIKDGALKRSSGPRCGWAHLLCAFYVPEVYFDDLKSMDLIVVDNIHSDRLGRSCIFCEHNQRSSQANYGVCIQCAWKTCRTYFHVSCAGSAGLLTDLPAIEASGSLSLACVLTKYGKSKTKPSSSPDSNTANQTVTRSGRSIGATNGAADYPLCGFCSMRHKKKYLSDYPHDSGSLSTQIDAGSCSPDSPKEPRKLEVRKLSSERFSSRRSQATRHGGSDSDESGTVPAEDSPVTRGKRKESNSRASMGADTHNTNSSEKSASKSSSAKEALEQDSGTAEPLVKRTKTVDEALENHQDLSSSTEHDTSGSSATDSNNLDASSTEVNQSKLSNTSEFTDSSEHSKDADKPASAFPASQTCKKSADNGTSSTVSEGSDIGLQNASSQPDKPAPPVLSVPSSDLHSPSSPCLPRTSGISTAVVFTVGSEASTSSNSSSLVSVRNSSQKRATNLAVATRRRRHQAKHNDIRRGEGKVMLVTSQTEHIMRSRASDSTPATTPSIQSTAANERSLKLVPPQRPMAVRGLGVPLNNKSLTMPDGQPLITVNGDLGVGLDNGSSAAPPLATMHDLLEWQWDQAGTLLMQQAEGTDVVSLLDCLHQLKSENDLLEAKLIRLQTRREHLKSVNARLSASLATMQATVMTTSAGDRTHSTPTAGDESVVKSGPFTMIPGVRDPSAAYVVGRTNDLDGVQHIPNSAVINYSKSSNNQSGCGHRDILPSPVTLLRPREPSSGTAFPAVVVCSPSGNHLGPNLKGPGSTVSNAVSSQNPHTSLSLTSSQYMTSGKPYQQPEVRIEFHSSHSLPPLAIQPAAECSKAPQIDLFLPGKQTRRSDTKKPQPYTPPRQRSGFPLAPRDPVVNLPSHPVSSSQNSSTLLQTGVDLNSLQELSARLSSAIAARRPLSTTKSLAQQEVDVVYADISSMSNRPQSSYMAESNIVTSSLVSILEPSTPSAYNARFGPVSDFTQEPQLATYVPIAVGSTQSGNNISTQPPTPTTSKQYIELVRPSFTSSTQSSSALVSTFRATSSSLSSDGFTLSSSSAVNDHSTVAPNRPGTDSYLVLAQSTGVHDLTGNSTALQSCSNFSPTLASVPSSVNYTACPSSSH
ncbi:unnamed protein product [Calicophoron daubneyi]|uniref:Uncharacterized protein n=1 Tax=Calicophoron daubneyi TaxID=300641 RepID=A0AAV2TJV8_CALDB